MARQLFTLRKITEDRVNIYDTKRKKIVGHVEHTGRAWLGFAGTGDDAVKVSTSVDQQASAQKAYSFARSKMHHLF
jgi:hypothetical protein